MAEARGIIGLIELAGVQSFSSSAVTGVATWGVMAAKTAKILIVDDQPEVGAVLEEYFAGRGFAVVLAVGGLEALAKIEKDRPAMVLLDVRMPDLDGVEVLRKIREAGPNPPVLMMSGNDDLGVAQRTLALGAVDYVLKPFDFEHIGRVVHKTLSTPPPEPAAAAEPTSTLPPPSPHGLLYDLALEIFQATRQFRPEARGALGAALEATALAVMQKGSTSERPEMVKALYQLRMLIRFARDLGDLTDEQHRILEAHLVRARRASGAS
jgi:DNA-binding response OmpR family regulator